MGSTSSTVVCTEPVQKCEGHSAGVNCLAVSTSQQLIASGSDDCTIRLWKLNDGDQLALNCDQILAGHTHYVTAVQFHREMLISGAADHTLKKWNPTSGACLITFEGHEDVINTIVCAGNRILSGSNDKSVIVWNFETGKLENQLKGHSHKVSAITHSGLDAAEKSEDHSGSTQKEQETSVTLISQFKPRECIFTGSADRHAKAWSVRSGKCTLTFKGHAGAITRIRVDATGRLLYTASLDGTVRSWYAENAKPQFVFDGHKSAVVCMDLCDKMLYTGSADRTARSWLLETGTQLRKYLGAKKTIIEVRSDGDRLVTASDDGHVRVYDKNTGVLRTVFGNSLFQCLNAFEMTPTCFITTANDGFLYLWGIQEAKAETVEDEQQPNGVRNEASE
ncbi:hypothetical protein CRM22_000391 [Opisthorchis felineus]|uniref:Uncharacterized protein n=1 Tax=Opisthorchis felineus TaxID=147828 RepID=A0A4S2MMA5_OPIFE|nr:hypothetical protein CRM22_000391 [Opisthorchis felineus]